jgi:hypothetical protein
MHAPLVSQGCRKFLESSLLLTNESQITPVVSGFSYILLQTDYTILVAFDNSGVTFVTEKLACDSRREEWAEGINALQ